MKHNIRSSKRHSAARLAFAIAVSSAAIGAVLWLSFGRANVAASSTPGIQEIYRKPAPDFDLNSTQGLTNVRSATGEQMSALTTLRTASNAPNMRIRWNDFGGSPDRRYRQIVQRFENAGYAASTSDEFA